MKKWTILALHVDINSKEFYVQNWGWTEDDIIRNLKLGPKEAETFRKTYFNGFEKDISDNEFKLLLETYILNYTIIGVYSINNNYNRDMSVINQMKDNVRGKWTNKGYVEVTHCDNETLNLEIDNKINNAINKRDYLFLLNEKIRESEKDFENHKKALDRINTEYDDKTASFYSLCEKYDEKKYELEKLVERCKQEQIILDKMNVEPIIKKYNEWLNKIKEKQDKFSELSSLSYSLDCEIERKKSYMRDIDSELKYKTEKEKLLSDNIDNMLIALDKLLGKYNNIIAI